ncbi:MAG TPA: zf-HC2 domain-containing protein [Blastocatellia bacterium]|nr:zf-HC2 domain-containing protein [Blastocatellia bacterium]
MEHWYIEEHNIADLYLSGKLPADERALFEQHLIGCAKCLSRLEVTKGLRVGLRVIMAEDPQRLRRGEPEWQEDQDDEQQPERPLERRWNVRVSGWRERWNRIHPAVAFSAAVLLMALPVSSLILKVRGVQHRLARAEENASAWRRRSEERAQTIRDLADEVKVREGRASAAQDQLIAQLDRERENRLPAGKAGPADHLQAAIPVFALSAVRIGSPDLSRPVNRVTPSPSSKWIVLWLQLEFDTDLRSYRASLTTADGRNLWRDGDLKPNSTGMLALGFNSSLFKAGTYHLTLEGLTEQGVYVSSARYSFRVPAR